MSIVVSRVFHAGYQFEAGNVRILFDPIFENPMSVNCYSHSKIDFDLEKIKKIDFDAVFISHIHDDHLSLQSLYYLKKEIPIYIFCTDDLYVDLIQKVGFTNVIKLHLNDLIQIQDLSVKCLPALDRDVDCLFHIKYKDCHILNVIDSWIDWDTCKKLSQMNRWDLILWPFQQMRELEVLCPSRSVVSDRKVPEEHLQQLQMLNPKKIIASSCQFIHEEWSWYRHHYFPISYELFEKQIKHILPNTEVIRLEPSYSFELSDSQSQAVPKLDWIKIDLESITDYNYQPNIPPQNLTEITEHFPKLDVEQMNVCEQFLQFELNQRWQMLDHENDEYPKSNFNWLLILYEPIDSSIRSEMNQRKLFFEINKNGIHYVESVKQDQIHWLTEICLFKLYQAIAYAESLSSLYIRINDRKLDDPNWKSMFDFDLIADPLLRILYEGKIGHYQGQQLKKIYKYNK